MANLGPRDLQNLVSLPAGWDGAQLAALRLQDNIQYSAVVAQMNAALGALNAEIAADPLWAGLISFTDTPEVEYRIGASNGFEQHTEYSRGDNKRGDTTGHILPLKPFDRRLGWTWDYLRKARLSQIQADIADAIKDARDLLRVQALTRILLRTDDSGYTKGLGTSGYSPGFATAAASTAVDFTPVPFGGTVFTSDHEHYVGIGGGAFTVAVFTDAYDELREHGHEPPFDFLIGPSDTATVTALTGFVKAADPLVQYGLSADRAAVDAMQYLGTISYFRVREVRGMPQYYGFGYKSYGTLSQRNPLRVRLSPGESRLRFIAMTDPEAGGGLDPLQNMMLFAEFGVGVGDRTSGTPRYTNNATWATGTPT